MTDTQDTLKPTEAPPIVTTEEILQDISEAAYAHSAATRDFITQFVFYGKTLSDWSDELAVPIVPQMTPEDMRGLYIKLANNIQIASHYYSISSTINSTLVGGGQMKKADLVTALVETFAKRNATRPAAAVIDRMADSYMKATVSSRVASKIIKEFWKQRLDTLIEVRKCLEQVGISLHTEMKYLNDELPT